MAAERERQTKETGQEPRPVEAVPEPRPAVPDHEPQPIEADPGPQPAEPDREPPLFDLLTPEGQELVPVYYRLFERREPGSAVNHRIASSAWYQAPSFACFSFHKPISRCRRHDEP
jgi:hypothetical protein